MIVDDVTSYTNWQAAISFINRHTEGAAHKLLEETRRVIWKEKQSGGGTVLHLRWFPGHSGTPDNKMADEEASRVASGYTHPLHLVPKFLINYHPTTNPTALKHAMKIANRILAETHWTSTDAGAK